MKRQTKQHQQKYEIYQNRASCQGRRPTMEDVDLIYKHEDSGWIFGFIIDGHGGTCVVELLKRILVDAVSQPFISLFLVNAHKMFLLRQVPESNRRIELLSDKDKKQLCFVNHAALKLMVQKAFVEVDKQIEHELGEQAHGCGAATTGFGFNKFTLQFFSVNLGDSRTCLRVFNSNKKKDDILSLPLNSNENEKVKETENDDKKEDNKKENEKDEKKEKESNEKKEQKMDQRVTSTKDHKPMDELERKRIYDAGLFVLAGRVAGNLALSRAFGDFALKIHGGKLNLVKGAVCSKPDVLITKLKQGDFVTIILACDGVWDVMDEKTAFDIFDAVRFHFPKMSPSKVLIDQAYRRGTTDNISAMILSFKIL